jgi:hypothetical protein
MEADNVLGSRELPNLEPDVRTLITCEDYQQPIGAAYEAFYDRSPLRTLRDAARIQKAAKLITA